MPAEPTIHTAAALLAGAGTLTAAAPQAGVDRELGEAELGAASMRPRPAQQLAEGVPGL